MYKKRGVERYSKDLKYNSRGICSRCELGHSIGTEQKNPLLHTLEYWGLKTISPRYKKIKYDKVINGMNGFRV